YVRSKVLMQSPEEQKEEDKKIAKEANNQQFLPYELKMAQAQMDMQMDSQSQQADMEQQQAIQDAGGEQAYKQSQQDQKTVDSQKGNKNRSLSDESKYKSAQLRLSRQGR